MIETTCTMDCPDSCALEVDVADGVIQAIRGGRSHPNTAGFICSKVAQFAKRVYHPSRILHPMRRTGRKGEGIFAAISWEEAIEEITSKFRSISNEWGGEAILPYHYGGSNGFLSESSLDDYFFARLGASRLKKTLCAAPTSAVAVAMYGKMPGVAFEDYVHSKFILIWGANPKASNIHLVPYLKEAKRRGAFIAIVDPAKNFSQNEIDLHLPVYPGSDLPLALALIAEWERRGALAHSFLKRNADGLNPLLSKAAEWPIERAAKECGIDPASILLLADRFSSLSPAVLRCGWGPERNRNGGQAISAILAMPALLGKFGVKGGGYTMSNSGAAQLDSKELFGEFPWETRTINMSLLGEALGERTTPPIKAMYVYNCNPVITAPDQNAVLRGLSREDLFVVVHEQVMTDTARFADILLPAPTFLEQKEIRRSYGSYTVGGAQPVIPPRGEALPNDAVFARLGRALGWSDPPFQWDTATFFKKVAGAIRMDGKTLSAEILSKGKSHLYDFPRSAPIQYETVYPRTADRKIHLTPDVLGPDPYRYDSVKSEKFPLALISPATGKMISSTLGEFNYPELQLTLHPDDAAPRSIRSGDRVRIWNEQGEVICHARVDARIRPGVAILPKGAWFHSSLNQRTATALSPSYVGEVGGGACYNDARVEVLRLNQ